VMVVEACDKDDDVGGGGDELLLRDIQNHS